MSQGSQWARRCSPSSKQGPMKATLPVSSLTRQNSNISYSNSKNTSPNLSPTSLWKSRISPEHNQSGIRSPGAFNYRGKCKGLEESNRRTCMRRTASLDTIYLSGQWPRESLYLYSDMLQIDRSTQTDDWLGEVKKMNRLDQSNEDKFEKYIKHRVRGWSGVPTGRVGSPLAGEVTHRHRLRSSVEGLNQEIEKLVLRSSSSLGLEKKGSLLSTPEGHRAPLAELLRQTRSVNTQTPAYSSHSSGPPSRESGSPMVNNISRPPSDSQGGSEDSSPEHEARGSGASPRINRFLAREPPDGCERVNLKFIETDINRDFRQHFCLRPQSKGMVDLSEIDYPLKPSMNFQLKPSLGSAFQPLRSIPLQTQETTSTQ